MFHLRVVSISWHLTIKHWLYSNAIWSFSLIRQWISMVEKGEKKNQTWLKAYRLKQEFLFFRRRRRWWWEKKGAQRKKDVKQAHTHKKCQSWSQVIYFSDFCWSENFTFPLCELPFSKFCVPLVYNIFTFVGSRVVLLFFLFFFYLI